MLLRSSARSLRLRPFFQMLLLCAGAIVLPVVRAQQPSLQVLHNHVRPQVSNHSAVMVSVLPDDQQLQASIVLPLRNQDVLDGLLKRLSDPASPDFRHFLSVEQFTTQFGPTVEDFSAVVAFAQANGLTVTEQPANRLVVPIRGSVANINAAFHVQMSVYQHPMEQRRFFSPDREPSLSLATPIAHIAGLDDYSLPQPRLVRQSTNGVQSMTVQGSGPGGSYLGSDMRAAYYGGTTLTGTGQAVALVEFGGYSLSDVNLSFSQAGQTYNVPINNVLLDGATTGSSFDDGEEVLDIVQAIGMAPGLSQVRVYIGIGNDDAHVLNSIATENLAAQVSCSWGWTPADPGTDDVFFEEMAAQGQTFFTASGDSGAYYLSLSPYVYPADDQYVTTVGGTHLTTNGVAGSWASEVVWNSQGSGSGGGVSPDNIAIPSWQSGVATKANGGSNTLRNSPDVAMEGDFDNFSCESGVCYQAFAGTSFAAPRWAGFMALVNQQAVEAGNAPKGGLGFINPILYQLGEGATTSSDFHDVTSGSNLTGNQPVYYNATTGYDLTTGWGSANGQALINDLAGPPVPGFFVSSSPASISLTPGATVTATLTITPIGGFTGNVTLAISSLPAGVTASLSPNPVTGSTTVTFTAASTAAASSQTITITGTSGTVTASANLPLAVHTPTFGLATSPASLSINQGTTGTSTVAVVPLYGFTGSVALSVAGLPAGVSAAFSPASTTGTSTLTLTVSSAATPGTSALVVTGVSGSLTVSTNMTLTVTGPTFILSTYSSVSVGQGSAASSYVSIYAENGFTGSVNLAVSGLPAGVTATINPNPTTTTNATITFTASSTAAIGNSAVTITGTSGSLTVSTKLTLGVYQPSFTINSPGSLTIGQGSSANSYVSVSDQYGFTGAVTFSITGLPKGATALWSPNPTTSNSTLTIAAASGTATGTYPLTIVGTSGSQTATSQLTLTVAAPTFTVSAYSVSLGQGISATSSVYVTNLYGFTGSVTLSASGLPSGVTASFTPNPTTSSSTLTLTASSTAALGQYNVTITGTSGSQTATAILTLGVYVPTFTLSGTGSVSVGQGSSSTGYVYTNAQYGFTGSVNLSVSGLPSGVTASFSPNPTTYYSNLTLTASSTAALGQYTLTITGMSGSQTATTTVTLGVYKPGFTVNAYGATLGQGTSTTSYAYVTGQYGFNGSVTLSASGLPSGVTVGFSSNPTTYSSTMTLTATSSVPVGIYTVTLNGVSGSLTASSTFTLTIGAPSFTFSVSDLSVAQGGSQSSYAYISSQYGFSGNVSLAASGLPSGATATFSPNPATTYSTVLVTVPASTPTGQYPFTVTATSGGTVMTASPTLTVVAPTFTVYPSSSTQSVNQGASSTNYIYLYDGTGFSGSVTFSASGLPSGLTASFANNPTTYSTQFTLSASASVVPGTYTITLTGTSGTVTASTTVTVTINAPGFALIATPASVLLYPGGTAKSSITFTALNGFSGSVAYAVTGLPTGVTATITPNPASAAATITFTASGTAAVSSGTVTVTGTNGSSSATVPILLNVFAPAAATTTTLAVTAGGSPVTTVAMGAAVTLTATVVAGSSPIPGVAAAATTPVTPGTVVFCDATATYCDPTHMIGAVQLTSSGTTSYKFIPGMGVRSYKAIFIGTTTYLTSRSAASSLTVSASQPTTTTLAQSGSAGNYTLLATVSGSGAVAPTGTVSFLDTSNGNFAVGSAKLGSATVTVSSTVAQSSAVGASPLGVVAADFNSDGIPDLAVSNIAGTTVSILIGNGDGTFQPASSLALGTTPASIAVGDFNHDGRPDLAVLRSTGGLFIFLGNGDGTFTAVNTSPSTTSYSTSMVVGDFNNDGVQDLAIFSSYYTPLTVLLGNGDGTFTSAPTSTLSLASVSGAAIGDFNGDGIADLAVTSAYGSVTILPGNGDGSFTAGTTYTISSYSSLATGDLNGDGKLDLVITSQNTPTILVLLGNGDGTFASATNAAAGAYLYTVALADFNGDGKPDIVGVPSVGATLQLLLGNGDGTFGAAATLTTAAASSSLAVADYNGDGIPDVALTNASGTVTINTVQRAQNATASATGISPLGSGQHAIDAVYAGDTGYTASTSSTVQLTAQSGPPSVIITPPAGTITTAQAVPVSITVSGGTANATPTGTLTLLAVGRYISAESTLSGGIATITVPAGTLFAGSDLLTALYRPDSNSASNYTVATGSGSVTVTLATPALTFVFAPSAPAVAQPATVTVSVSGGASAPAATGTVQFTLGSFTGSATLSGGSAAFNVPANTLTAGSNAYSASYTPDGASSTVYAAASATGSLALGKATPAISWAAPASITYGTALSAAQLNATSPVAGTFVYSPVAGTVLSAGTQTLSVTFTPTDTADYTTAIATVTLVVNKAVPSVSWATPTSITYGTALSAAQLNATSPVAGTFTYIPAAGAVLSAGTQTLSVTLSPTDNVDYNTATATVTLTVSQATPAITWPTPAAITYGTALGTAQLNASSSVAGTFAYTPSAGTVPAVGTQTLSVTFTPNDTADFTTATATVSLTVTSATPSINWATPAGTTYGTALSSVQLNATSPVAGTFAYTPAVGTVLTAGTQTLSVTFTPNDSVSYKPSTATVQLTVAKGPLSLTAANATRPYGTANPTFTGTLTGAVNNDVLTESFATTATSANPAGTYAIVPAVVGAALGNYSVTATNGTLTITLASTTTAFALSNSNLTFTATVTTATSGTPTGSVNFYSGSTLLGSGTLTAGVASYTATTFPSGSAALSAVYAGDTNFAGSTSTAVPALSMSVSSTSLTVATAGSAQDTLTLSVVPGYTGTIQFACSGLPAYATCAFSPTTVTFTGSTTTANTTLTLHTGGTAALEVPSMPGRSSRPSALLAMLGLPALLTLIFTRRRLPRGARLLLMIVLVAGGLAGLGGCAGGSNSSSGGSQSTPTPSGTYLLQILGTGTSGVSQSTSVSVTVQ